MARLTPEEVKAFLIDTLQVSGAAYREVDNTLLLAEVTVEIPPLFFDPPRLEKQTLNLVFTPEASANYPGAELVIPGSYRLNWFIDGLQERGNYTLQHFKFTGAAAKSEKALAALRPELKKALPLSSPAEEARPFLLVNYTLSFQTDELQEELVSLGLDMVSGTITPDFFRCLGEAEALPGAPETGVATPSYTLEAAFALLHQYLEELVQARDPRWVNEARVRYEEELTCLYQYYQEDQRDFGDFHSRALDLYDKFRPRVLVRPVNVGLLYLPVLVYQLPKEGRKEKTVLRYLPFLDKLETSGEFESPTIAKARARKQ
ncbi:MAG TPA: hypothetical protein GXZ98_01145 [Firmicutes bacterium]|jgi:hypothetical protein|nr:hypothetical protein [Bacillota bacterium]